MSSTLKPRPATDIGEHLQSRFERSVELREIGGLCGVREIRRRRRTIATLKAIFGGDRIPDAILDLAVAPIECRRTRLRREGRSLR